MALDFGLASVCGHSVGSSSMPGPIGCTVEREVNSSSVKEVDDIMEFCTLEQMQVR